MEFVRIPIGILLEYIKYFGNRLKRVYLGMTSAFCINVSHKNTNIGSHIKDTVSRLDFNTMAYISFFYKNLIDKKFQFVSIQSLYLGTIFESNVGH